MGRLRRLFIGSHPSPLELIVGPEQYQRELRLGGMLILSVINGTVVVALTIQAVAGPDIPRLQAGGVAGVSALGFAVLALVGGLGAGWQPEVLMGMLVPLAPAVVLAMWFAGPNLEVSAAVIPVMVATAVVYQPRRVASWIACVMFASYGLMISLADGYPQPVARFAIVLGFAAAGAALLEWLFRHLRVLAERDRANAAELKVAHAQLADTNLLLESRVTEQVDEIERLGRLRRFLSPQVADTVMSSGGDDLLTTHRRQIAVVFVDLRGFTAFSAVAEPEDVVDVLTDFYAAVGKIVKRLEATVGAFAGDGVMAYFNDPVPCDDPAGRALDMATSLRLPMSDLGERWSRRGFNIGYGVGIAYGYATLGTIGFEERSDYTPLGSVVNLASRLCDEAANGEILLDGRAHEAVHEQVHAETVQLELKGFSGVVTAYRVQLG